MKKEYSNLGEVYYERRLSNGLLVRVVEKLGFVKTHAFLAVEYGSMDTDFVVDGKAFSSPKGIAHYLEHKMFDMPDCNVMQLFSQYGGNPNAFTSYDVTAYYVECADRFEDNLKLLLQYVFTPYFTQESVEKERGIIAQEIKMYEDNPDSQLYEKLFACLYDHHPIKNAIAGTVESIGEITAQTLYDCYNGFYKPENMMLCVVGDVDAERVFAIAEELVPSCKKSHVVRDYGAAERMLPAKKRSECVMEVSMPMFSLGFKTEPANRGSDSMVQEIVGELASELLVGESSPLYSRLYEKNLIDSGFSCGYEGLKGVSMLNVSGDSYDPEAVCQAILEETHRIKAHGIDRDLFSRLKRSSMGRRIRELDSFDSVCYKMCAYYFEGVEYFSFPELFRGITVEQVEEFLLRTVTEERMAVSIIRPEKS